jgi:hypothetical protein
MNIGVADECSMLRSVVPSLRKARRLGQPFSLRLLQPVFVTPAAAVLVASAATAYDSYDGGSLCGVV